MDQDVLKTNLNGLERKILMLINEHKNLREEVKNLKVENQALRQSVQSRDQQLDSFKNQIKITRIADRIHPEDGDVAELKKKVDDYIREIDKCIAHLSQ
jgi:chromosome segregation ATPase